MTPVHLDLTDDIRLTRQGKRALTARARLLRGRVIPDLEAQRASYPRDDSLRAETERVTAELAGIAVTLARTRPAEAIPDDPQVVELGEAVTIRVDGIRIERYIIVHPCEAGSSVDGQASSQSPLGRALLGRRIGDEVEVPAPGGTYRCVIECSTRPQPTAKRRRA